jgi:hypothetical protein
MLSGLLLLALKFVHKAHLGQLGVIALPYTESFNAEIAAVSIS